MCHGVREFKTKIKTAGILFPYFVSSAFDIKRNTPLTHSGYIKAYTMDTQYRHLFGGEYMSAPVIQVYFPAV